MPRCCLLYFVLALVYFLPLCCSYISEQHVDKASDEIQSKPKNKKMHKCFMLSNITKEEFWKSEKSNDYFCGNSMYFPKFGNMDSIRVV